MPVSLDLQLIDPVLADMAREAYAEGDARKLLCSMGSHESTNFLFDNLASLRDRRADFFHQIVLHAYTGTKTTHAHSYWLWDLIFPLCDR